MKSPYVLSYIRTKNAKYNAIPDDIARFVIKNQLLCKNSWNHFVYAFKNNVDVADKGWRGEYWGKMMRGACLTYMYTGDEELYNVLSEAVKDMLRAETANGTFTTYNIPGEEFQGWDIWSRKYILTGFQHFYDICRDEVLKKAILDAICRHADYMCKHLGNGEGQINITKASNHWLGVNSCSVLEPILRLHEMTGKESYKLFAEYIISTGGIDHELNLISLALENKLSPYQYPENKAYETMSFFEGVLAYYELFGTEEYLAAVTNFVEAVYRDDVTVIGCSGCTHELFDNSAVKQTQESDVVAQETCVTVTWMRLLARLYRLTGKAVYAERIERSALNAMYGSVNTLMTKQVVDWKKSENFSGPFCFDSYSPLNNGRRGIGIGGYKVFEDGFSYGCCACIGSAGTAIYPLTTIMESDKGIVISSLWTGSVKARTPKGGTLSVDICGEFPKGGKTVLSLGLEESESLEIKIRVPEYCDSFKAICEGKELEIVDGYAVIEKVFSDGEIIEINVENSLRARRINDKTVFMYGPVVLARDAAKESEISDLTASVSICEENGELVYSEEECLAGEMLRFKVKLSDGGEMLLTDYASCGKDWNCDKLMTIFFNRA